MLKSVSSLSALVLLAILIVLLTGCGSGPEPSATDSQIEDQQLASATTPSTTPSLTASPTAEPPSPTPSPSATPVPPTPTPSPSPSATPVPLSPTPGSTTALLTSTPSPEPSPTDLPTATPTATDVPPPTKVPEPLKTLKGGSSPLFGLHMGNVTQAGGLQQVLDAGTRWLRLTPFDWDRIEPQHTDPPNYNWAVVDNSPQGRGLKVAAENGMDVIAVVRFAPEWAQMHPGHFCGPIKPESLHAYGQFLRALVARYSQPPFNVKYWELGNEPDVDPVLAGGRNGYGCWGNIDGPYYGGGYYAEMLKVAYTAIKETDPKAKVLLGGLLLYCDPRDAEACASGTHGVVPGRFLEGILRNGGGDFFDILSFHAYALYRPALGHPFSFTWPGGNTTVPEKAAFLREVLNQYGYGDKPLLNSEAAPRCREANDECFDWQATYMPQAFADALAADLIGQVYFSLINDSWYSTGLLRGDLSAKPAYAAFKVASQMLGQAEYQGTLAGYPPGLMGYTFRRPDLGQMLDLIWSVDGLPQTISSPSGARVYDRFGAKLPASAEIQVGSAPVYIVRP